MHRWNICILGSLPIARCLLPSTTSVFWIFATQFRGAGKNITSPIPPSVVQRKSYRTITKLSCTRCYSLVRRIQSDPMFEIRYSQEIWNARIALSRNRTRKSTNWWGCAKRYPSHSKANSTSITCCHLFQKILPIRPCTHVDLVVTQSTYASLTECHVTKELG